MNKLKKIALENELRDIARELVAEARETDGFGWDGANWCHTVDDLADIMARRAVTSMEAAITS